MGQGKATKIVVCVSVITAQVREVSVPSNFLFLVGIPGTCRRKPDPVVQKSEE